MNSRVYIETTIFSYLTAWRSPQLVMAAQQETTRQWWDDERPHFDLYVSEAMIEEAAAGDPEAAQRRLKAIPELRISNEVRDLAKSLIEHCRHIANATLQQ